MSLYQWQDVIFREKDHTARLVPGTIIGDYTVSPALMDDCSHDEFSTAIWRVSERHYGIRIVEYTDFKVAINFARFLNKQYGSLESLAKHHLERCLTEDDKRILIEIDIKRNHASTHNGEMIHYIPFNPEDY